MVIGVVAHRQSACIASRPAKRRVPEAHNAEHMKSLKACFDGGFDSVDAATLFFILDVENHVKQLSLAKSYNSDPDKFKRQYF